MFIVEVMTTTGKLCERCETYEEARRRVDGLPAECLLSIPFIFEELADGSQRLVREDGKPLQWHRLPYDEPEAPDQPLPLCDDATAAALGTPRDTADDEPLPLCDGPAPA